MMLHVSPPLKYKVHNKYYNERSSLHNLRVHIYAPLYYPCELL